MNTPAELRARADQHFAHAGQSLLITDLDAAIPPGGAEGYYYRNTRLLSRLEWRAAGERPRTIAASPVGGSGLLAYAELPAANGVPARCVYVGLTFHVDESLRLELSAQNYHVREPARFDLELWLDADFADLVEARDGRRQQNAEVETGWSEADAELTFRYRHPGLDRAVVVRVRRAPPGCGYRGGRLIVPLDLAPHSPVELSLSVEPAFDGARRPALSRAFDHAATRTARLRAELEGGATRLVTSNPTVARAWETAVRDLASLPLGLDAGPAAPAAGVPIYQQFFGRDTLTIGWQALMAQPLILRDSLREVAATQGRRIDDWLDEEPGRLIHEARWGPLSALGLDSLARYYGDFATPPDFLIMLGQYLAWTDDRETVFDLLPAARAVLDWCDRYGDLDRDGFLEYVTRSPKGLKNQGWRDSDEGVIDAAGEIVPNPIASSEIQSYWFVGLQSAAAVFLLAGDPAYANELWGKALRLKERFHRAFWMEAEGFYAMALGPDKRPVRSIASNAGHLLGAGIVPRPEGARVAWRLMQPDLFSGWGVRTLSSAHPAYNPFAYHLGSVWPVENGTFALGFARYGCWPQVHRLAEGIFAASDLFMLNRLPEALGGLPRDSAHPHPGIYPEANAPQGWSASAIVILVQSLLGMIGVAPLGLLLVDPHLPPWLPDLRLEGLRVGRGRVDLEFWRGSSGQTRWKVVRREGKVRVIRQPPPETREATPMGRLAAAVWSLPALLGQNGRYPAFRRRPRHP